MSRRLMLLTAACVGVGAITIAPVVRGSPIHVNLVPDNPGPYFGGESLTVDVWLESHFESDVLLEIVQFDFGASDDALNLAPMFEFDHSAITIDTNLYANFTYPDMPAPFTAMPLDCICPTAYIQLNSQSELHIGSVYLELPSDPGNFTLDALNSEETEFGFNEFGTWIGTATQPGYIGHETGFAGENWFAHSGEIGGGNYEFDIVPEPVTVILTGLAFVFLIVRRRPRRDAAVFLLTFSISGLFSTPASARPSPTDDDVVLVNVDSGFLTTPGTGNEAIVVFSEVISIPNSPWLRLYFFDTTLSSDGTNSAFIRITSVEDGSEQTLTADGLTRWRNSSAYFNGDEVLVALLTYPGLDPARVQIDLAVFGSTGGGSTSSQGEEFECFSDDRCPSSDPRSGRLFFRNPGDSGCSAWLIDDYAHCLLTAGHCVTLFDLDNDIPVLEFNVPFSDVDGTRNHPPTEHQYAMDVESLRWEDETGGGKDWAYFGVFPNEQTGLAPVTAQGAYYSLATTVSPPSPNNDTLRITGYGIDKDPPGSTGPDSFNKFNATHQTAVGTYRSQSSNGRGIWYLIPAVSGNSGSPVIDETSGVAYAIHNHSFYPADCGNFAAPNATRVDRQIIKDAIANPLGVCNEFLDCNHNFAPDNCDVDCNAFPACLAGFPGSCGTSDDCTGNGPPDECEPDCQPNGVPDSCDILNGAVDDNEDGIPDECLPPPISPPEPERLTCKDDSDCIFIEEGEGGVAFAVCTCGVAPRTCACGGNDDCPLESVCRSGRCYVPRNRYLSVNGTNPNLITALQVTLVSIAPAQQPGEEEDPCPNMPTFSAFDTEEMWVDEPDQNGVSRLTNEAVFRNWSTAPIEISDCNIVPCSEYDIRAHYCDAGGVCVLSSTAVTVPTSRVWGDVANSEGEPTIRLRRANGMFYTGI